MEAVFLEGSGSTGDCGLVGLRRGCGGGVWPLSSLSRTSVKDGEGVLVWASPKGGVVDLEDSPEGGEVQESIGKAGMDFQRWTAAGSRRVRCPPMTRRTVSGESAQISAIAMRMPLLISLNFSTKMAFSSQNCFEVNWE